MLACGVLDGGIHLLNGTNGNWRHSFPAHTGAVRQIASSPDGTVLATVGATDGKIYLWDVLTRKKLRVFQTNRGDARRMAFTPDGKALVTGTSGASGGKLELRGIRLGDKLPELKASQFKVSALAISSDGKWLAVGAADADKSFVKLWDLKTGEVVRTMAPFGRSVTSLAFSPDGARLAGTFGYHNLVREWNPSTGTLIHDLERSTKGHSHRVPQRVVFNSDNKTLAAVTDEGVITLWEGNKKTVRRMLQLDPPVRVIHDIAFSPEGRHLVSANSDGTLYILRLKP